jgi:branched-chain amino acid transport system substrate-binding protein
VPWPEPIRHPVRLRPVSPYLASPCRGCRPEIVIGEINPRSGHLAKHGAEIHQGILYAVEEANSRGGLGGYPLRLISRDDQSKPEVAINQAQNLIHREKVVGLLGGYVDSLVGPISELAAKYRCPMSLQPVCSVP